MIKYLRKLFKIQTQEYMTWKNIALVKERKGRNWKVFIDGILYTPDKACFDFYAKVPETTFNLNKKPLTLEELKKLKKIK